VLATAAELFRQRGFGLFRVVEAGPEGGVVECPWEHYAHGWVLKFGLRARAQGGVSHFAAGFARAAFAMAFRGEPGHYEVEQTHCRSLGDDRCRFVLRLRPEPRALEPSVGAGIMGQVDPREPFPGCRVASEAITQAVFELPTEPDERGLIPAFGVLLAKMYANYYNLTSFRFLERMEAALGQTGQELVESLLVEAGHVCAFNTFGGIMESAEWAALVKPQLHDAADWAHGIVAVANALGWGALCVDELAPEKLLLSSPNGYESNFYLSKRMSAREGVSYMLQGIAKGVMNLIFNADIQSMPQLDEAYYAERFKSGQAFGVRQIDCRIGRDGSDSFLVNR